MCVFTSLAPLVNSSVNSNNQHHSLSVNFLRHFIISYDFTSDNTNPPKKGTKISNDFG